MHNKQHFYVIYSRRDPGDGKGKYTATTHLRRWGTVVRTHTPNIHHPANREANNGHITGNNIQNNTIPETC